MTTTATQDLEPRFQHGLLKPRPGHMPTLFTLIIVWAVGTIFLGVLLPFQFQRFDGGWFAQTQNILLLCSVCGVSTLHGVLGYLLGYHRGGRVSNFFVGALLLTLGLVAIVWLNRSRPEAPPTQPTGLMRRLDRAAFLLGSVWFGLVQLAIIMVFVMIATIFETGVGADGNKAAYANFYNHWTFGLIFLLFFMTIYCTTMRKWPFRIAQTGWLATHAGLLVTMVGCMTMFWGTYEGFVKLLEGQTTSQVLSRSERELRVAIPALGFDNRDDRFLVEVDHDPIEREVEQKIPFVVAAGGKTHEFEIEIDRFLSNAEEYSEIRPARTPREKPAAAFSFEMSLPGQGSRVFNIFEDQPSTLSSVPLKTRIIRVPHRSQLEAFTYRYDPGDRRRGELVISDEKDRAIGVIPIVPGARGADAAEGADVGSEFQIPGGPRVRVVRYFSYLFVDADGRLRDETPDSPLMPGISFVVDGPQGRENHSARCDDKWFNSDLDASETSAYPYRFAYRAAASNPQPAPSLTFVVGPGEEMNVIVTSGEEAPQRIKFEKDAVFRLSSRAPLRIKALAAYADAELEEGIRQGTGSRPAALRVTVRHGKDEATGWVFDFQRDLLSTDLVVGDFLVRLGYAPRATDLGFKLSLIDFRHENYPNSDKAKRYEANVIVDDGASLDAALIDMNHPLEQGGYRFFNQNPIGNDNGRRGVIFAVGRNPGMPILLIGFTITGVGLVLVFFFKPSLRAWEKRRREAAASN
ncbi:MAG: cytochrome c biogenesis protein ResB [Planctomycetota bacterium]